MYRFLVNHLLVSRMTFDHYCSYESEPYMYSLSTNSLQDKVVVLSNPCHNNKIIYIHIRMCECVCDYTVCVMGREHTLVLPCLFTLYLCHES